MPLPLIRSPLRARHGLALALAAMVLVMGAIGTITFISLHRNDSDLRSVTEAVTTSDSYWALLNSALEANLESAQMTLGNDPEARNNFLAALSGAFVASEQIKANGSAADRKIIAGLEQQYAGSVRQVLAYLSDPGGENGVELPADEAGTIMDDVTEALTAPASERRSEALASLRSLQKSNDDRAIAILAAIGLGLPAIVAVGWAIGHYERKNTLQEAQVRQLKEAALTDSLTGLGNHRAFQEELLRQWAQASRDNQAFTLAVMDLDDFKVVNDTKGHAQGDEVLSEFAKLLSFVMNPARAFRVGGDEFAVIMLHTHAVEAQQEMTRLLHLVEAVLGPGSVSIGLCSTSAVSDPGTLREKADFALYEAKRRGKALAVATARTWTRS
jgi:diguanylate cyclase (GGDEF)-like protein